VAAEQAVLEAAAEQRVVVAARLAEALAVPEALAVERPERGPARLQRLAHRLPAQRRPAFPAWRPRLLRWESVRELLSRLRRFRWQPKQRHPGLPVPHHCLLQAAR